MIGVEEALSRVLERARPRDPVARALPEAVDHALAEPVRCSLDSPPHDKALVDGYALRAADAQRPERLLRVLEEVTAGRVPTRVVEPGTATRIMTGAPLPHGADAVVMVERSELVSASGTEPRVRVTDKSPQPGQNIMRRGDSMRSGDIVLRPGHRLRPIEIGLLAELGISRVLVFPRPTVAVLATGDELVACEVTPATGQIRNSNGPMLEQLVIAAGGVSRNQGIARDTESDLTRCMRAGLESDVLVLSGGVSAGVLDLVPQVLQQLGVQEVFHKVQLKPGKPLWFGVLPGSGVPDKLVFGLPGNPVSSLVCFHLFVRPALARLAGVASPGIWQLSARLAADFPHRSDRPTFHPGRAWMDAGQLLVEPLAWRGSADLRTLADANVLVELPIGTHLLRGGDLVSVRPL